MSDLLTGAATAGLKVIGVSLNMTETGLVSYQKAISLARLIFALGKSLGHDLTLLDLGEMMPMNNQDFVAFEEVTSECTIRIDQRFLTFLDLRAP
jgi:ornithine decarboxylase